MPESFERCRKAGGKIRNVSGPQKKLGLAAGEYLPVCIKNGKTFPGYKKKNHLSSEMTVARSKRGKDDSY